MTMVSTVVKYCRALVILREAVSAVFSTCRAWSGSDPNDTHVVISLAMSTSDCSGNGQPLVWAESMISNCPVVVNSDILTMDLLTLAGEKL